MLKLREISKTYGLKVYTDDGDYFGDIEEVLIQNNRIFGWRIRSTRNSILNKTISGARGVVVPHQLVKASGDIVIISKAAVSVEPREAEIEEAE